MTIQFTVYDASGTILRTGNTMTVAQAQLQATEPGTYVTTVGTDPDTQIILPGTGQPSYRGPMQVDGVNTSINRTSIVANGIATLTISPIPPGALYAVTVPQGVGLDEIPEGTINDGSLVITTTVKGTYSVRLRSGYFLDYKATFNAT